MALKSLKRTKPQKLREGMAISGPDVPDYPYGTRVNLETDCLKKLGLDVDVFKIGDQIPMMAMVEVVRVHKSKDDDGENQSLDLQVTHMDLKTDMIVKKDGTLSLAMIKLMASQNKNSENEY